jgi:hypothetical protein
VCHEPTHTGTGARLAFLRDQQSKLPLVDQQKREESRSCSNCGLGEHNPEKCHEPTHGGKDSTHGDWATGRTEWLQKEIDHLHDKAQRTTGRGNGKGTGKRE